GNAVHASTILRQSMIVLRTRTVDGIAANDARARELLDRSTAAATALSPHIGYTATAEIAKEAVRTGESIRQLVLARGLLDAKKLDEILSVDAMTKPGIVGEKSQKAGKAGEAGKAGRAGEAGTAGGAGTAEGAGKVQEAGHAR